MANHHMIPRNDSSSHNSKHMMRHCSFSSLVACLVVLCGLSFGAGRMCRMALEQKHRHQWEQRPIALNDATRPIRRVWNGPDSRQSWRRTPFLDHRHYTTTSEDSWDVQAFVHPAMAAVFQLRRVALIGDCDRNGALLAQVLQYRSVEEVIVVAGNLTDLATSDCRNIVGSTQHCVDDPRVDLVLAADPARWLAERYPTGSSEDDLLDVIMMGHVDVNAPDWNAEAWAEAIGHALSLDGLLLVRLAPHLCVHDDRVADRLLAPLQRQGFDKANAFGDEPGLCQHMLVVIKDNWTLESWFGNEAYINLRLRHRLATSHSGAPLLSGFDGAAMQTLVYPSRVVEQVYCDKVPTPEFCDQGHGFDPEKGNLPIAGFEVKPSLLEGAGRGVFFKESVPNGTYIAIESTVNNLMIMPATRHLVTQMTEVTDMKMWKGFYTYIPAYGFSSDAYGDATFIVDSCILTFMNHGCNRTNNMGTVTSVSELTADPDRLPDDLRGYEKESYFFNPFLDRNYALFMDVGDVTRRDVQAGEELLDNYLVYYHEAIWKTGVLSLRQQCLHQAGGLVTEYETMGKASDSGWME